MIETNRVQPKEAAQLQEQTLCFHLANIAGSPTTTALDLTTALNSLPLIRMKP